MECAVGCKHCDVERTVADDVSLTDGCLCSQVYAKDNNKENHSSSPVISPKSTLRRQAKVNNNVLLPR